MLPRIVRRMLAFFFIGAGVNHFFSPAIYLAMMPPFLPQPEVLNTISGIAEILGGIGLLIPSMRRLAGWGLIALLVAVFPANVHVAVQGHWPGVNLSPLALGLRLPFQAVLIASVWWVALRRPPARPGAAPTDAEPPA